METMTFDEVLDECVTMMHSGASVDECVSRFPDHAEELRLQLTTAEAVLAARNGIQPEASAQAQGRTRLLSAVAERREAASTPSGFGLLSALWGRTALLPRAIPVVLAMLLVGGAAWGVSAAATGNPNPGAWFSTSSSSEERIEFEGVITAITQESLTVDTGRGGRTVLIDGDTELEDEDGQEIALTDLSLGDRVKVLATRNDDNALVAIEVERAAATDVSEPPTEEADSSDGGEGKAGDGDQDGPDGGPGDGEEGEGDNGHDGDGDGGGDDEGDHGGPGGSDGGSGDGDGAGDGDDGDGDHNGSGNDDGDDHNGDGHGDHDDGDSSGSSSNGPEVELRGIITALASGRITIVVDGRTWIVIVDSDTEIGGEGDPDSISDLSLGDDIKVHGTEGPDGTVRADHIELEHDGDGEHEEGHEDGHDGGEEEEHGDDH